MDYLTRDKNDNWVIIITYYISTYLEEIVSFRKQIK